MVLTKDEIIRIQQKHFVFPLRADQITIFHDDSGIAYAIEIDVGNSKPVTYFFNKNHQYIEQADILSTTRGSADSGRIDPEVLSVTQSNSDFDRINRDFTAVIWEVKRGGNISNEELEHVLGMIDENWRIHIELIHETHRYLTGITLYLNDVKDKCSYGRRYIVGWRADRIPIYGVRDLEPEQKRLLAAVEFLEYQHSDLSRIFKRCVSVGKNIKKLFQGEDFRTVLANSRLETADFFAIGIEKLNSCFTMITQKELCYNIRDVFPAFTLHLEYLKQVLRAVVACYKYTDKMQRYLRSEERFRTYSEFQKEAVELFQEYGTNSNRICRILEDVIRKTEVLLCTDDIRKIEEIRNRQDQCLYGCPTAKMFRDSEVLRTCNVEIVEYE